LTSQALPKAGAIWLMLRIDEKAENSVMGGAVLRSARAQRRPGQSRPTSRCEKWDTAAAAT